MCYTGQLVLAVLVADSVAVGLLVVEQTGYLPPLEVFLLVLHHLTLPFHYQI